MTRDAASRGVLLLTWQEVLRLPDLEALRCSALIVVLPSTEETARAHESKESTGALSFWHTMKQRMLATEWTIPVYFVEADAPRVQDMISSSANNDATKAKGKVASALGQSTKKSVSCLGRAWVLALIGDPMC